MPSKHFSDLKAIHSYVIYIDREEVRRRELWRATNGDGKLAEKELESRKQGAEMEKIEDMETYKRRSLDLKLAQKALREWEH